MPTADGFLDEITRDYKRLQEQKARRVGGVEGRVLLNLAFEAGEQYTSYANKALTAQPLKGEAEANKLHLVFNLLAQRGRKLTGRLASIAPSFKARPDKKDPKAFEQAEVVDRLIVALDQKLDQPSRTWELLDWLRKGGTAFEYVPWVKNAALELTPQFTEDGELLFKDLLQSTLTGDDVIVPESQKNALVEQGRPPESFEVYELVGEVGDVGSEIHGPLSVFVDQTIKSISDLAPDQAVYIARVKTHGWIAETYGPEAVEGLEGTQKIDIVTTAFTQTDGASVAGVNLSDLVPMLQGTVGKDDPKCEIVVERYQPSSTQHPHGRFTCFVPAKKVLFDGENPYEEIPLVHFHWTPPTTTFWSKDYVTDLIAPQRFLNKRLSQLGEQSNSAAYAPWLLAPGVKPSDIPTDFPGAIENGLSDNGTPRAMRAPGAQFPGWFMQSIDLVVKLLNDLAGGADLFDDTKGTGQMRGPMAVPLLQEIIDTEWGPLFQHIGERMARVKQMRLNRVKQFYPPSRTLHYTDKSQRDEVLEFHTDAVLRSGTTYKVTVDRGTLVPEFRALREARVRDRLQSPLAILYTDERTGRLDKTKIAADLQFGDTSRESQESQDRKLAMELISRLWKAEAIPPVLPFYNHRVMLDELESAMKTTEFLSASPPVQQLFMHRWQEHRAFLDQQAQAQQQAIQDQMTQQAVAQATQQAAAQAASETVKSVLEQLRMQAVQAPSTAQLLGAQAEMGGRQ